MKKLLLILLCVPIIGFGQTDCGDEPKEPNRPGSQSTFNFKQTPKYKKWKKEYNEWVVCNGGDISKYKFSSIDSLTYDMVNDIEFCQTIKNSTKFKTYTTENGTIIRKGDTLYIGKPSSAIIQSSFGTSVFGNNTLVGGSPVFSNLIVGNLGSTMLTGMVYLDANSQGNMVIVEYVSVWHTKMKRKSLLNPMVFVKNPKLDIFPGRTVLNIEKAINFGEIINPNAPLSREEAIAKLKEGKDLLDLGLLSLEEYEVLKNELSGIIMRK